MKRDTLYVFDLDGTLYDNRHRQHLCPPKGSSDAKAWARFANACSDDTLRPAVAELLRALLAVDAESVVFLTGRSELSRSLTADKLCRDFGLKKVVILMRKEDDLRPAAALKAAVIESIRALHPELNILMIEDDPSVVDRCRLIDGVTVLQIDSLCSDVLNTGGTDVR